MTTKTCAFLLTVALLCALPGCGGKEQEAGGEPYLGEGPITDELPVTRVALYQNGVGYFERAGQVEGDIITLRIRPDQINDILKSLTVIDLGDGRPVSISLPVDKRAVDELASLPSQIRDDGGLRALLLAFRGARVALTAGATVEGRLVGVESHTRVDQNGNAVPTWRVTIKQDDGLLTVVLLDDVTSMRIQDRTLEVGLDKSLDISLNDGSWKPIELKVRMSNATARKVLVSYIVSMPIWKPAYRLVLGDEGEGLFQGWAVVDNVSGSDWERVRMSLIAGTPMSFLYDLYAPQFVARPDLTPRGQRVAVAPVQTESARATSTTASAPAPPPAPGGGRWDAKDRAPAALKSAERERSEKNDWEAPEAEEASAWGDSGAYDDFDEAGAAPARSEAFIGGDETLDLARVEQSFAAQAEGSQLSALFQYDIASPVTVPDRSSALVNLVQSKGKAQEIVLFRPDLWVNYDALAPYRAVELHNTSGYALEPGPITLYRDGTFIGEGFLPRTERDSVAFVTFALDPQVTLKNARVEAEEAARITRIHGGSIESELKQVTTVEYEIKNLRDEAITAVIRRPVRANWKLDPVPDAMLEAAGAYYLPVEVAASETKTFALREVTPITRSLTLDSSLAIELLQLQLTEAGMDPELKGAIETVIAKRAELTELTEELDDLRARKRELEDESYRIANSLADIKDVREASAKALREQLIGRAAALEKDIGQKATRIAELDIRQSDTERTLRALFRSITFERKEP